MVEPREPEGSNTPTAANKSIRNGDDWPHVAGHVVVGRALDESSRLRPSAILQLSRTEANLLVAKRTDSRESLSVLYATFAKYAVKADRHPCTGDDWPHNTECQAFQNTFALLQLKKTSPICNKDDWPHVT
jgi:hypothetical protein